MLKCRAGSFRHWTAQLNGSYAFAAAACFPHSEEPFQREKALYRVIQRYFHCAASPPVEVLREGGRGRAFFSKSPSSPSQTPPLYPQRLLTLSNPSCWGCRCCEAVPVNGVFVWKEGERPFLEQFNFKIVQY